MRRLAAAALAAWAGCAPAQPAAVAECAKLGKEGRECLLRAMRAHPAKSAAFWEAVQSRPIDERLGPAPPELVDYLHLDNAANGFPEKPRASRPSAEFMADMRGAIADLPSAVRRAFDATFAGVWLVRRVPPERFYGIIYWLLLLVGAKLVYDGLRGLHLLG